MTERKEVRLPPLDGWALILGASSGFGEATSLALARAGVDIIGVHLDRRATAQNAERIQASIRALGREAWFFNINAADAQKRAEVLDTVSCRFEERAKGEKVRVLLHSLAFGTLKKYVSREPGETVTQKQLEMTCDVMAHSLVYWVQELDVRCLLSDDGRIYAMTSEGAQTVWGGYGPVSAAKCALESHIRQLARELAPRGVTANAICAGVTDTPASRKIPAYEGMVRTALAKNPSDRLTRPEDVANAIVALAQPCTYWLTGGVLYVDGGECHCGGG